MIDVMVNVIFSGIVWDSIKFGIKSVSDRVLFKGNKSNIEKISGELQVNNLTGLSYSNVETYVADYLQNNEEIARKLKNAYKTEFAKKLDYYLSLINLNCDDSNRYNIERLSSFLNYESSNVLKQYYTNTEEPSFQFLDEFADKLMINKEWIKTGIHEPFYVEHNESVEKFLEDESVTKRYLLFISDSAKSEAIIAKQYGELQFKYINHIFSFHGDVGTTGLRDIEKIEEYLKFLRKDTKDYYLKKCSPEMLRNISEGKVFMGMAIGNSSEFKSLGSLEYDFLSKDPSNKQDLEKYYGQGIASAREKLYASRQQ